MPCTENEHARLSHVIRERGCAVGGAGDGLKGGPSGSTDSRAARVPRAMRHAPGILIRGGPVTLGAYGAATTLAEVIVQLPIRQDQEEALPDGHRPATCVAVQERRLKLLELLFHRPYRADPYQYPPLGRTCQAKRDEPCSVTPPWRSGLPPDSNREIPPDCAPR